MSLGSRAAMVLMGVIVLGSAGCGSSSIADVSSVAGDAPDVVCLGYVDVEGGAAALRPERPGRVVKVNVQEGDEVAVGAALFALDDGEARAELAQAEAGMRAAQAREALAQQEARQQPSRLRQLRSTLEATGSRLAGARVTLRRQEDLYNRGLGNRGDVDLARENVREFEASVAAARARVSEAEALDPKLAVQVATAEVETARARVDRAKYVQSTCILRAPSKGSILTLAVRPGEVVGQPGGVVPVLFCPDRPFVVRAEVEQELVSLVEVGQEVRVRDEIGGLGPWKARLVRVGRTYARRQHRTDPTQFVDVPTVECLIRLDPGHPPLRIGQKLRVSIYASPSQPSESPRIPVKR